MGMEPVALLCSAIDLQPSYSFLLAMIHLFSYFNVFGEVQMDSETMKATYEGSNYLKAVRKIHCPGRYTEVNGEGIVRYYSHGRGVVRMTFQAVHSF
jgi:hypothetical protein